MTPARCPVCGSLLPPDAPGGHCPVCLLALVNQVDETPAAGSAPWLDIKQRRFANYLLGKPIGAGGMGVVYEARQLDTDRQVAVKLIRDVHVASPAALCRFTIEAEAAARLDHPNIVRVHQVGECHGCPYICMDYVAGESLHAHIAQGQFSLHPPAGGGARLNPRARQLAIARLMSKIARAVQHAHEHGVLHRDLKPGNILMDGQGEPYLTDFGLAKLLPSGGEDGRRNSLTGTSELPGTPCYMSPEQVRGDEVTRASDLYGLGAILYELLTGRPPFGGPTPLETFKQIAEQPPLRPRAHVAEVDGGLETICLKCLEKLPRHRYSSAAALAEDLGRWREGRPILARPASPMRRTVQWVRRNPIGTALIASLCLGLFIALTLLMIVAHQRQEIQRDRDQTFDEGMTKISLLWRDPATREVTISARELAILAGRSPADTSLAGRILTFGASTEAEPSSMAQSYARLLCQMQQHLSRAVGAPVGLRLKLFKRFNADHLSLARGEADLMMLSAVDFLEAQALAPGIVPIAHERLRQEAVLFVRTNSGVTQLSQLAGRAVAFTDPRLSLTPRAKARLMAAGVRAANLRSWTNLVDQGVATGQSVISYVESLRCVLSGAMDAGLTYRDRFERYKHLGLVLVDRFPEPPNVLAAHQGLDPPLIQALLRVMGSSAQGRPGPDGVLPRLMPLTAEDDDALAGLRQDLQQARRFDAPLDAP